MQEHLYVNRDGLYIPVGSIDADLMTAALPPVVDLGLVVGPNDDLQEAIDASKPGGLVSVLAGGMRPPFQIPDGLHGLTIQAHPDSTHRQVFSGLRPFDVSPWREGYKPGVISAKYTGFPGRHWHWSRSTTLQEWHKLSACPDMIVWAYVDRFHELMPVFNLGDLVPGTFYVEGAIDRPEQIHVMPPVDAHDDGLVDLSRIYYAASPWIVRTPQDGIAESVTIRGFDFAYAGSTHKRGAVYLGPHGLLEDASVSHSVGAGVLFDGPSPTIRNVRMMGNGQCSFYGNQIAGVTIEDCRTGGNGTRKPNFQHEAGGKLVGCVGATIRRFQSTDDPRPIWLDVSSHSPTVEDVEILRPIAAGVQFEHGCNGVVSRRVKIKDVQGYTLPEDGRVRRFGLVIQSRVFDGILEDYEIDGADIGFFHKKHERRGGSGRITANRFTYQNCGQNRYTETMTRQAIEAAILAGAQPQNINEWFAPDLFDATV